MNKPTKTTTIIDAICHKQLFGSLDAFKSLDSWVNWIAWLKAIFCIPMTDSELGAYRQCTGRQEPPTKEPSESYTICGRRGGKSFISSLVAVYLACFRSYKQFLNAGEWATVLVLARDRDQSRIVFGYIKGILNAIPALRQMIVAERADEIELENGVVIAVKTSDYRSIRGITVVVCIADEIAFWNVDGTSPDHEILTALRPAMATIPDAKLLVISTPYAQSGVLYEQHRDYYAKDDEHTLVWVAPTHTMNPTINEGLIQRELERDPDGASAEYLATFRSDLSAAFSPEALEKCTVKGRDELPASPILSYSAFVDPSGGKADAFTVAVAHRGESGIIIDCVRGWDSPFNPKEVTAEIAKVIKGYGVLSVTGDRFAAEWPVAEFREHGISYEQCEKNKSELYLAFVPVTNSGGVELPDDKRLLTQLRRLERKRGRAGKDTVDHPARLYDDLANSVAGVSYLLNNNSKSARHEFNPSLHISREDLKLVYLNWPLFIGLSCEDGVAASVVAQLYNTEIRVFFAAVTENISLRRHIEEYLKPWLSTNAQRLKMFGGFEQRENPQIQAEMRRTIGEVLGNQWVSISTAWEIRRDRLLSALTESQAFTFKPRVQINPANTSALSQGLNAWVYEKSQAEKKNYHVVNAFSLMLARCELWKATPREPREPRNLPPSSMSI